MYTRGIFQRLAAIYVATVLFSPFRSVFSTLNGVRGTIYEYMSTPPRPQPSQNTTMKRSSNSAPAPPFFSPAPLFTGRVGTVISTHAEHRMIEGSS